MDGEESQPANEAVAPLSLRAYARHRQTSVESVRRAVKSKRLRASLVVDEGGQVKIADPLLADREWAANTDLTKAPNYVKERARSAPVGVTVPVTPLVTPLGAEPVTRETPPRAVTGSVTPPEAGDLIPAIADAAAIERHWKSKQAELDYRRDAGEVVPIEDVLAYKAGCEAREVEKFTRVRTSILGVPSKAKGRLPHLTHQDVRVIEELLREALQELAEPLPAGGV